MGWGEEGLPKPETPCKGGEALCYSPEQLDAIGDQWAQRYKEIKLEREGLFWRFLKVVTFRENLPADLGEAAKRTLNLPKEAAVREDQLKKLGDYFETEKAGIEEIQSRQGFQRRQAFEGVKDKLNVAMGPLAQTPLLDSLLHNGYWLTRAARSGEEQTRREPRNSRAWDQRAGESYGRGNYGEAIREAGKARELDPENEEALAISASAHFKQGNYPAAAESARAALKINPDDLTALTIYKLSEGRDGGLSEAERQVKQVKLETRAARRSGGGAWDGSQAIAQTRAPAVAMKPASVSQSSELARQAGSALGVKDYQTAVDQAGRAIAINPQNAQAYNYRAMAHSAARSYEMALNDAVAGLKLAPKSGPLLNSKASALNRLRDYNGALEAANIAIEINPRDASAFANRAFALGGLGDREGMLADLKTAASLDPRFESTLQAALQLPESSDVQFLFSGEFQAAAPAKTVGKPSRKKRFSFIGIVSLIGGGLLAIGLWPFIAPWRARTGPTTQASSGVPDPYEIIREIGAGGMGVVYEATDRSLERRVAIKKMRPELSADVKERKRFVAEAKTVAALHHPNIVDIFSIVEDPDVSLVFEFVSGHTVHDLLAPGRGLVFPQALKIIRGMGAALEFAHNRGVIHRDLKPSNVMIDEEGRVKVMDFGIARIAKDALIKSTMTNTVMGTPPYMSPEQEQGVVCRESDVYSLAVCAYEILSGKLPFAGTGAGMLINKMKKNYAPLSGLVAGLPKGVDEVFARAFEADPKKRIPSPQEFVILLEERFMGVN